MPIDISTTPVAGSNEAPDYAKQVTDRLSKDYVGLSTTLAQLRDEAIAIRKETPVVNDDAEALARGAIIKRLKDLDGRIEAVRVLEKEPYLRSGNAVDALFKGWRALIGRLDRNDRKQKAGITDILQAEIDDYQDRKLAAEKAAREAEMRRQQEEARKAAEEAARIAREAAEKAAAAERARKEENRLARAAEAEALEQAAAEARVRAQQEAERAEDARIATLAKPAEMTRIRGNAESGGGVTLTTKQEGYALLVDRYKLDMKKLLPFFTEAELEKALRQFAKTTGYREKMDGAEIGFRNAGVTR